jgi:hypothetical protein
MNQLARAAAREARQREIAAHRAQRMYERNEKARARAAKHAQKEARQRHIEEQEDEAEALREQAEARCDDLAGIVKHTLSVNDALSFESLRRTLAFAEFQPPPELRNETPKPIEQAVVAPSFLVRWIPWVREGHEKRLCSLITRCMSRTYLTVVAPSACASRSSKVCKGSAFLLRATSKIT